MTREKSFERLSRDGSLFWGALESSRCLSPSGIVPRPHHQSRRVQVEVRRVEKVAKQIEIQIDLGEFERTRHVESSEVYLVSATSRANPKIRDGKMDIKTLERVNEDGLEQWKPDMKAQFPVSRDQVTMVFGALNLASLDLDRDEYDLKALLALVGGDGRARAVYVDKVRDQYDVKGCTVEMSDVTIDGDSYKTVAAESSSETLVWETVGMLGLEENTNTNYVMFIKGIKELN